jgi:hypothetical protein
MLAHLAAYYVRLIQLRNMDIPLDEYPFTINVDLTDDI